MRYFLGFLASIGLVVVVIILIIRGFGGGGGTKTRVVLADYAATEMAVELTVDGRITADETHNGYHILVDRFGSKIETYRGYQNNIIESKTFDGNVTAYTNLLRALDLLGYTKGDASPSKADERGVCPLGQRYIYELKGGPKGDQRFWSTSCGGGTFGGNSAQVRQLFRLQVPAIDNYTGRLKL